ncbi:unnamed protein product, partial [Acanthoscelides obtectus]
STRVRIPPANRYPFVVHVRTKRELKLINKDIPEECLKAKEAPSRDAAIAPPSRDAAIAPRRRGRPPKTRDEIPVQVSPEAPKRAKTLLERSIDDERTGLRRSTRVRIPPANRYPFVVHVRTKRELKLINKDIPEECLVSAFNNFRRFQCFTKFTFVFQIKQRNAGGNV